MLAIHHLSVDYPERSAVEDINFYLHTGDILTLVGPTGCGKSSVLRAIAGLLRPSAGEIVINGICTCAERFVPPEKRRTGLVFQDFALFPHLNVEQNVGFRVKERKIVDHWLNVLGLESHRQAMPETLSGGQKQRVALARSLAHDPMLVLLDEPLSNLDMSMKAELRWQIREALKASGVTAIWVTHDQEEALSVGDKVAVMNAGRLEQVAAPEICYAVPTSRFVARFLGKGFFLGARMRDGCAETSLGPAEVVFAGGLDSHNPPLQGEGIEVLVRPHDVSIEYSDKPNAEVLSQMFEGETRLYAIRMDEGVDMQVRADHALAVKPQERVKAHLCAPHPLTAFPEAN